MALITRRECDFLWVGEDFDLLIRLEAADVRQFMMLRLQQLCQLEALLEVCISTLTCVVRDHQHSIHVNLVCFAS